MPIAVKLQALQALKGSSRRPFDGERTGHTQIDNNTLEDQVLTSLGVLVSRSGRQTFTDPGHGQQAGFQRDLPPVVVQIEPPGSSRSLTTVAIADGSGSDDSKRRRQ
ncbi:hypothetical protein QC761_0055010 [Podospora bellae-mahoneyi]|uniref:Uncharacterized protein n=1 Tax=Podospora bellae-mahoneyi TaxID=2093777 RepID=A0ABR0FL33_9PEZI|nr:hypothetical protein QC761_0055010 [Podospora bellae-mahoneyi]